MEKRAEETTHFGWKWENCVALLMQSSEREASRKWEIKVEFSGITW
jgi:hypothetical protein